MKAAFALVAALLLGACQTDKLVTKQADDPRPTSVNPIAKPKGPQVAKGAVLFIDGIDFRNRTHMIDNDTPDILQWFSGGGFDVFRVDLSPKDQVPFGRVLSSMDRAIADMRRQNYRRVFVVGQSAGGFSALASLVGNGLDNNGIFADGAIAFAPGVDGNAPKNSQVEWHSEFLSISTPSRRIAVFHFKDDELFQNWHKEAVQVSLAKLGERRNAMVRVPPAVTGHLG